MQIKAGKTSIRCKETGGKQRIALATREVKIPGARGPEGGARVGD